MSRPATAAVRLLSGEREPCRVATTANIALQGLQSIDGVSLKVNDRVVVKDQTDPKENGIYTVSTGVWYRASDARDPRSITEGVTVQTQEGTTHAGRAWRFANPLPNIGDDPIVIAFYLSASFSADVNALVDSKLAEVIAIIGGLGDAPLVEYANYASRAIAAASFIPSIKSFLITAGYTAVGDGGGALYKRVSSAPTPALSGFQSADGGWWQIAVPTLSPEMFGAIGNGTADDTVAVQACIDAQRPSGAIAIKGRYRITSQVIVQGKSLVFQGSAYSGNNYTGFVHSNNGQFYILNSSGCRFERIGFRADSSFAAQLDLFLLEGSSNMVFMGAGFVCTDAPAGCYMTITKGSNRIRFIEIQASGAAGAHGFFLGGPTPADTATGANIADFSVFSIGAAGNCDAIVFDGSSGSARFVNGAMNFGRRAFWVKSSGFLYITATGFENHTGDYTLQFDVCSNVSIVGCYINGGIMVGEKSRDFRIAKNQIRAAVYHGMSLSGAQLNVSGNNITRNSVQTQYVSSGIKIGATAKNVSIQDNNICKDWIVSNTTGEMVQQNGLQKYAIENDAPRTSGVIISGNLMNEYQTTAIGGLVPSGANIFDNEIFV